MGYPDDISNGDFPDASAVQEWFTKLSLKRLTYDEMITFADENPTDLFFCYAHDMGQWWGYSGNTADGDNGFTLIA